MVANWFPRFLANGLDYLDVRRVLDGLEQWSQWADRWSEAANAYEKLGDDAQSEGHLQTAAGHLTRAAMNLQFAQFVLNDDLARRRELHLRQACLYRRAAPLLSPPARPVAIPFDGIDLGGYFRRPTGSDSAGLVILMPGLESTKEQFTSYEPFFLERGMATLSVEGPGQGETRYQTPFRADGYVEAWQHVLRFVDRLDGIDRAKLALVGTSFGGHLALKCASTTPEMAAVVDIAGPYDLTWFDDMQPILQEGFVHLFGADGLDEARRMASTITLDGALDRLDGPVLIVHGNRDGVIPPEHAHRIHAELGTKSEMWLIPDGNHSLNNMHTVIRPAIADWVADRFEELT